MVFCIFSIDGNDLEPSDVLFTGHDSLMSEIKSEIGKWSKDQDSYYPKVTPGKSWNGVKESQKEDSVGVNVTSQGTFESKDERHGRVCGRVVYKGKRQSPRRDLMTLDKSQVCWLYNYWVSPRSVVILCSHPPPYGSRRYVVYLLRTVVGNTRNCVRPPWLGDNGLRH